MSDLPPIDPFAPHHRDPGDDPPPPKSNGHDPNPQSDDIEGAVAGVSLSFTRFKSRDRLSKRYDPGPDGKVITTGGTEMYRGEYATTTIEAADPPAILADMGRRIDVFGPYEAIGIGIVIDGQPASGDIIVKEIYERVQANPQATKAGIPRAKSHFVYPTHGLSLLFCDGDEKDNLHEILTELWPGFAEVAALVRPSASASVKDPATGERLKTGEHLFALNDDPTKTKAILHAILRLSWCVGVGRSAGWVALAKDGDPLVYGPVDVTVWGTERLIYEGEVTLGEGLERLPRNSTVCGGNLVLNAAALIKYANKHAPLERFNELVEAAKNKPEFLAEQVAVKAAYRADHIEKAVARGEPREKVEKEFDRVTRASKGSGSGVASKDRIWRELSLHQTLFFPNGKPFTGSDMAADPQAFHKKECADPVEGLTYQSRNPGIIYHQGGRIEIYSRAHGDRYAYFLPLLNMEDFGGALRGLIESINSRNPGGEAQIDDPDPDGEAQIDDNPDGDAASNLDANIDMQANLDAQAEFDIDSKINAQANLDAQAEFDAASNDGGGGADDGGGGIGTVTSSSAPTLQPKKKKIPTPVWREIFVLTGRPKPSLENARLALTSIGIACRHDRFSDRIIFGWGKDNPIHAVEVNLGEVTDNGLKALRQVLSKAFGFDLGDQFVRDAVETLALENGFNPRGSLGQGGSRLGQAAAADPDGSGLHGLRGHRAQCGVHAQDHARRRRKSSQSRLQVRYDPGAGRPRGLE
jgi:hypothetical protein